MNVDHYHTIGAMHVTAGEPCQDYSSAGVLKDGRVFGIVCDGCSGADGRPDIGARLLALAMEEALAETPDMAGCFGPGFSQELLKRFAGMRVTTNNQDYLASVVAFCADAELVKVFMFGDGVVTWRTAQDELKIVEVHWPGNAPYYLGYGLESAEVAGSGEAMFEKLSAQPGYAVRVQEWTYAWPGAIDVNPKDQPGLATASLEPDLGLELERMTVQTVEFEGFRHGYCLSLSTAELMTLAVTTDGLSQVGGPAQGLSTAAAAHEMLAFKNYAGSFVKRRALKGLSAFAKRGLRPQDDLAIAAIALVR